MSRGRVRSACASGSHAGEVVEAQPQHDACGTCDRPCAAGARRGRRAPTSVRVDLVERLVRAARARAASRSTRAAGRPAPAADRGCARARAGAGPTPRPSIATSTGSPSSATSPTVVIPRSWSLSAVIGPTPHSRPTGSGCRKSSSRSGGTTSRPSGFATPLATLARNFVRATPTVIASPTRSSTSRRSRDRDLGRRARHAEQAADVEERLVDREPLDERRRVVEHLEHRLARLGVRRHARRHDDRAAGTARAPGARPSRCARRTPWPRSSRRARRPRRRSPAGRAAADRRAARPTRRTRRGRRAGSSRRRTRTHVRTRLRRSARRRRSIACRRCRSKVSTNRARGTGCASRSRATSASGGREANTFADTGLPIIIVTTRGQQDRQGAQDRAHARRARRRVPARRVDGRRAEEPGLVLQPQGRSRRGRDPGRPRAVRRDACAS